MHYPLPESLRVPPSLEKDGCECGIFIIPEAQPAQASPQVSAVNCPSSIKAPLGPMWARLEMSTTIVVSDDS